MGDPVTKSTAEPSTFNEAKHAAYQKYMIYMGDPVTKSKAEPSTFNEAEHEAYRKDVVYIVVGFIILCTFIVCGKSLFSDLGQLLSGIFGAGNTLCAEIEKLLKSCDDGFFQTKCVFMWLLMIPGGLGLIYGMAKLYIMIKTSKDNEVKTTEVELLTGKSVPELINDIRDAYGINDINDLKKIMEKNGVNTINEGTINLFFKGLCTKHLEKVGKEALSKQVLSPENIKKQIEALNEEARLNQERAEEAAKEKDVTEDQRAEVKKALEQLP